MDEHPSPQTKKLHTLLQRMKTEDGIPERNPDVTGIVLDSRQVELGSLFVALRGTTLDGHRFIPDAVSRGCSAVVGTRPREDYRDLPVPYLAVADDRQALADLSAAFYDYPAEHLIVIGVTGTDGKTTTANLIFSILHEAGCKVGMISTVNALIGDDMLDTGFHVTTPEAPHVQRYLRRMVDAGLTHVILEATSHGLAQKRVGACRFDVGVVTNITHEHLDYHGSYQAYREAKAELLRQAASSPRKGEDAPKAAVLNRDDRSFSYLSALLKDLEFPYLSYGLSPGADVWAENIQHTGQGLVFDVHGKDFKGQIKTPLIGEYNVSNCLAAVTAAVVGMGIEFQHAVSGVRTMAGIPGRMEVIDLGQPFQVIVDFAHTPNALERALRAAREMTAGRIIAVFGSAGLRDKQKRRLMAEISARLADQTVLTAEDPRTESLADILEEMAEGARSRGGVEEQTFWRVPDRGNAIRFALSLAKDNDLVMICGKGHEQSMCFGTVEYAWDDRTAARAALAEYLDLPGPEMPYLPTRDA